MTKPRSGLRFAMSHTDTLRANKAGMQHYEKLSGRDTPAEQLALQTVREKVTRKPAGSDGRKLERDVNAEITKVAKMFHNVKLWRNNRGQVMLPNGGRLTYGVGPNGAADFIGYRTITVTSDMIGEQIAQFLCIESKRPGENATNEQMDFAADVYADGGRSGVAHSGIEAIAIMRKP